MTKAFRFRAFLIPLLLMCLLVSGCGGSVAESEQSLRQRYDEAQYIQIRAEIDTDLSDQLLTFELSCVYIKGVESRVEILSPEIARGVRAVWSEGRAQLEYDGVVLDLGARAEDQPGPAEALPLLIAALTQEDPLSFSGVDLDGQRCVMLEYGAPQGERDIRQNIWLDGTTYKPVYSEIFYNGVRTITCRIDDVLFEEPENLSNPDES